MWLNPPEDISQLLDKRQRLQNLYYLTDKNGNEVPFNLNWAQTDLADNMWHQMLVLKARQLGVTTFFAINFLDDCFWMENISSGIIAHRKEDAADIFRKKVKYAYDRMPEWTRAFNSATNDRAGELAFKNGSSYRVSTGFRSGTYQRLLVSEFGKICAKSPDVAKEIVTGSLNTVSTDQIIAIESTAEGREGYFFDYSKEAELLASTKIELSPMQMRFFFFPWFKEPGYREFNLNLEITQKTENYLKLVTQETGFKFDDDQKRWYEFKSRQMSDSMKQEYPSTPSEAFEASNEGLYFGAQIAEMRRNGKICKIPYQETFQVHCSFDLGFDDHTSIWFFQLAPGGVIQVIDYYEMNGKGAKFYVDILKEKRYTLGTIILPHDSKKHEGATTITWEEIFRNLLSARIEVLGPDSILSGIESIRSNLSRCYFDETKCIEGIRHLEAYKKEWNDKLGCYNNKPLHNKDSHATDSFRYLCMALDQGLVSGSYMTKEKLQEVKNQAGFGAKPIPLRHQIMNANPFVGR